MSIALFIPDRAPGPIEAALGRALPGVPIVTGPTFAAPEEIRLAVTWKHPKGALGRLPNLEGVLSYGAGYDHLEADPPAPGVAIGRTVPASLPVEVAEYVLAACLAESRGLFGGSPRPRPQRIAAVLGLGAVGQAVAAYLRDSGFDVRGAARTPRRIPGVTTFHGPEAMQRACAGADHLISALPLIRDPKATTVGVLGHRLFALLRPGAHLVNVGRGQQLQQDEFFAALQRGQLRSATLDVTSPEPLPRDHPLRHHPQVRITPHCAGITEPEDAAACIAKDYRSLLASKPFTHPVVLVGRDEAPRFP